MSTSVVQVGENSSHWWLPEAFKSAVQGLSLSQAIVRRMDREQVLSQMDEATLCRLTEPLSLANPAEVAIQLEKAGGSRVLFSPEAQKSIADWNAMFQVAAILRELSKTVTDLMRAYRQEQLVNPEAVLRILPVLAMSHFIPGSDLIRNDLTAILKSSSEDTTGLIKGFREAALSGDTAVVAIDQRIQADPVWSGWSQVFLREGRDLCQPPRPVTIWEFPDNEIVEGNGSSICGWLFRRS
jgi:hypothetical protein